MPSSWPLPPRPTKAAPAGRRGHSGRHPPHVPQPYGTVGHCHAQEVRGRPSRLAASACRHRRERPRRPMARHRQAPAAAAAGNYRRGNTACTHRCSRHGQCLPWGVAPRRAGRGCRAHRRAHGCFHHHAHRGYGAGTTGGRHSQQPKQQRRPRTQQRRPRTQQQPPSPQGTGVGGRHRRPGLMGGPPSTGRGQPSGCDHLDGRGQPCRHRHHLREWRERFQGHPPHRRGGHLQGKTGVERQLLVDPARHAAGGYRDGPGGLHRPMAARRPRDSSAASAKVNGHAPLVVPPPPVLAGGQTRQMRHHRRHEGIQKAPLHQGVPHVATHAPHRGA